MHRSGKNTGESMSIPNNHLNNRVGLFGGSFNPIHYGHLTIAAQLVDKKIVDEVWFIPCKHHAFDKDIIDIFMRLEMIVEALKEFSRGETQLRADDIELVSGVEKNYTIDTIIQLKVKSPHKLFYWIIGSDTLPQLHEWHEYGRLLTTTPFLVYPRQGYALTISDHQMIKEYGMQLLYDVKPRSISSTAVREHVKAHLSIEELVPKSVERYIQKNKLYQGDNDDH